MSSGLEVWGLGDEWPCPGPGSVKPTRRLSGRSWLMIESDRSHHQTFNLLLTVALGGI